MRSWCVLGPAALAIVNGCAASARAQDTAPFSQDENSTRTQADELVVVGQNGRPFRLTADSLRDAAKAFIGSRATFAPAAILMFEIRDLSAEQRAGLGLYLFSRKSEKNGQHKSIDLAIDSENRFQLPIETLVAGDWELRANRSRGRLRIWPLVLSPDSTFENRRVGDFRSQCRVDIAFIRISAPFRVLVSTLNVCNNKGVQWFSKSRYALESAQVDGYNRSLVSPRDPTRYYRAPIADKTVSDNARLRLDYLSGSAAPALAPKKP